MEKSNVTLRRKADILENKSKGTHSEMNNHGSSVSHANSPAFSQFKELREKVTCFILKQVDKFKTSMM